ncbi:MAG: helix-turn-helix domain-containing protein [Bacteroidaceae bacterium]|nr:helix-turn-helix domain-containing protein [Bacteroidaceae bacterium]
MRQEVDYHNATADLKCAEFLTPTETARLLRISRSTLYRYLSSEDISTKQRTHSIRLDGANQFFILQAFPPCI